MSNADGYETVTDDATGDEGQSTSPPATSSPAENPPADQAKPGDDKSTWGAVTERLNRIMQQRSDLDNRWNAEVRPAMAKLKEMADEPNPAPPTPYQLPPPPTQQQKGNAAEAVTSLMKLGGLLAIGFGAMSLKGGAVRKAALTAAIGGYAEGVQGRNHRYEQTTNETMKLWEKQREFINAENKQQIDEYHAVLADKRLKWQQQKDILEMMAREYGNYRMQLSAQQGDLREITKTLNDMERLRKDAAKEEWDRRPKLHDVLGKSGETDRYKAWVYEQSGHKIRLTDQTSADDVYKAEEQYPYTKFLEQEETKKGQEKLKEKEEERAKKREESEADIDIARRKSKAEALGRKEGEAEAEKEPVDKNAPLTDEQRSKMRNRILQESSD